MKENKILNYCFIASILKSANSIYNGGKSGIGELNALRQARLGAAQSTISGAALLGTSIANTVKTMGQLNTGQADNVKTQALANLLQQWNNTSTIGLMNQAMSWLPTAGVTYRLLMGSKGNRASKALSGIGSGAAAGASAGSAFGPWGTAIGAAVGAIGSGLGAIFGNKKAQRKARNLVNYTNALAEASNNYMRNNMANNALNIQAGLINSYRRNMAALGGNLYDLGGYMVDTYSPTSIALATDNLALKRDKLDRDYRMSLMPNNISAGNTLLNAYDLGGLLNTQGATYSTGLNLVNEGETHEENPYGGIPMGRDNQNTPNFVEENESIYNNYVFSDRLTVPNIPKNHLKNPKRMSYEEKVLKPYLGMTFSDAAKKAEKTIYGEGGNINGKLEILYTDEKDKKDTLNAILAVLAETQELVKLELEIKELLLAIANMSPEEIQALLQLMMSMQQLEAQLLQMAELQAVLQQLLLSPEEQAMMQQLLMLQQLSPEEIAAMQLLESMQQSQMSQEESVALLLLGYAYGGNLYNGNYFKDGGFTLGGFNYKVAKNDAGEYNIIMVDENGNTKKQDLQAIDAILSIIRLLNPNIQTIEDLYDFYNTTSYTSDLQKTARKNVERLYKQAGLNPSKLNSTYKLYFESDVQSYLENETTPTLTSVLAGKNKTSYKNYYNSVNRSNILNNVFAREITPNESGKYLPLYRDSQGNIIESPSINIPQFSYRDGNYYNADGNVIPVEDLFTQNNGFRNYNPSSTAYDYSTRGYYNTNGDWVNLALEDNRGGNTTGAYNGVSSWFGSSGWKRDDYLKDKRVADFRELLLKDIANGKQEALLWLYDLGEKTNSDEGYDVNGKIEKRKNRYFKDTANKDKLTSADLVTGYLNLLSSAFNNGPVANAGLIAQQKNTTPSVERAIEIDANNKPLKDENGNYIYTLFPEENSPFYSVYNNGSPVATETLGDGTLVNLVGINRNPIVLYNLKDRATGKWYSTIDPSKIKGVKEYKGEDIPLYEKDGNNYSIRAFEFDSSDFDNKDIEEINNPYPMPNQLGSTLMGLTGAIAGFSAKPDYSRANALLERGYFTPRIAPMMVERPLPPKYLSLVNAENNARQAGATAYSNIRNTVNPVSKAAALIAAANRNQVGIGNLAEEINKINNSLYSLYYAQDLDAMSRNLQAQLTADTANQQAFRAGDNMISAGIGLAENIDKSVAAARSAGMQNLANTIYRNERDYNAAKQAAWYLPRSNYPGLYGYTYGYWGDNKKA